MLGLLGLYRQVELLRLDDFQRDLLDGVVYPAVQHLRRPERGPGGEELVLVSDAQPFDVSEKQLSVAISKNVLAIVVTSSR